MPKFCEQCGTKLDEGEIFCSSCGARVENDKPPPQPQISQSQISQSQISESDSTKISSPVIDDSFGKLIKGIIGVMFVIFIAITIFHSIINYANKSTNTEYNSSTQTPGNTTESPPLLTESDLRIGNLSLSTSKSYIDGQLGAGKIQKDGWYDYGDFWAKFDSDGKIYWLSSTSKNLSTPRGIHAGSTLNELQSVYNINQFRKEINTNTVSYAGDFNDMTLLFSVLKNSDKVDEIVLVKNKKAAKTPPPTEKSKTSYEGYNYGCTVNGEATYKGILQNGVACALYSIEKQKRIISNYGDSHHTARGIFYAVTVIVGNSGLEPIISPSIYLIDEHGRKFSSDITATSTWVAEHNFHDAFNLNPGQPDFMHEVFDIPENVNITHLRCESFNYSLDNMKNSFDVPFKIVKE